MALKLGSLSIRKEDLGMPFVFCVASLICLSTISTLFDTAWISAEKSTLDNETNTNMANFVSAFHPLKPDFVAPLRCLNTRIATIFFSMQNEAPPLSGAAACVEPIDDQFEIAFEIRVRQFHDVTNFISARLFASHKMRRRALPSVENSTCCKVAITLEDVSSSAALALVEGGACLADNAMSCSSANRSSFLSLSSVSRSTCRPSEVRGVKALRTAYGMAAE
mmetsp:Transcript_9251/g.17315  ORF Transcript_9251/g.17315 Transcript_9251/m.17315 type:complete len:222 (+) Transcript_9251:115-780(+)